MIAPRPYFRGRLCVALDSVDRSEIDALARAVSDHVGLVKIGLGSYASFGPALIGELARSVPVFVDLKLHDIPMQVRSAARALADAGASLLTVHASGGMDMMEAAVEGAGDVPIVAVTILTSIDQGDMSAIGFEGSPTESVMRLTKAAIAAGAAGVVCSPLEVEALRATFGDDPLIVTPGIRSAGDDAHDQSRTMDARSAVTAGSDVVVVGRPITGSADPGAAAAAIAAEIA